MPNRILKESICTSDSIDQLSMIAEITFYRLMVNCDDYGRMDARAKILKAKLFPLKDYLDSEIMGAVEELEKANLITIYKVEGKPYLQMNTWERHQQVRNHKSKYPSPSDSDYNQLQSNDISCNQMISDDSKCPRNPIQSESLSESESLSVSLMSDGDAQKTQHEHDMVLRAAEDAGFQRSNTVRAQLIALYADHGLEKLLNAIKECAVHGAVNLAYLQAVLRGGPKKQKPKVIAQDFPQRDYSGVQDEMMSKLSKEIEEMNKTG